MRNAILSTLVAVCVAAPAFAQELTWRQDIQPILKKQCGACHGPDKPEYAEWLVLREKDKNLSSRMDTYAHFMNYVAWPATGAVMRRLDDGKAAGGKPGNMHAYLGSTDEERAANLDKIKRWLGDGAWNLNRWETRGSTAGIAKEQIDKIKAKY